ncbi:3118_t:CDS:1, partial [Funneliformis caledonium]
NIKQYAEELKELLIEEFLDDKQIIKRVIKDPNEEVISDSESELEIII